MCLHKTNRIAQKKILKLSWLLTKIKEAVHMAEIVECKTHG
jgi:hypothetical protein